jgi:hypothetical protein
MLMTTTTRYRIVQGISSIFKSVIYFLCVLGSCPASAWLFHCLLRALPTPLCDLRASPPIAPQRRFRQAYYLCLCSQVIAFLISFVPDFPCSNAVLFTFNDVRPDLLATTVTLQASGHFSLFNRSGVSVTGVNGELFYYWSKSCISTLSKTYCKA